MQRARLWGYLISALLLTIESKKETDRPDSKSDRKKYAVYTLEEWATLANENRIYGTGKTRTQNLQLGSLYT